MDGLVRGPWKRRTDHFAPLVHAPKKTISLCAQERDKKKKRKICVARISQLSTDLIKVNSEATLVSAKIFTPSFTEFQAEPS
jgi:hypothetical protein